MLAAKANQAAAVQLLLQRGANALAEDRMGKRASQFTAEPEIRQLLLQALSARHCCMQQALWLAQQLLQVFQGSICFV